MRGRVVVAAAQQATPSPSPALTGTAGPTSTAGAGTATTAAQPAAAPQTGGQRYDGGPSAIGLLAVLGGVILIGSAVGGVRLLQRR
jgi:hypothetical protein